MLWFDVGNGRYTTPTATYGRPSRLWFDVGNGRYTTNPLQTSVSIELWFDVGNGRYTTLQAKILDFLSCGLM